MSTTINNIDFDITNLKITNNSLPIQFSGGRLQHYTNMQSSTIEMTATTSLNNFEKLKDWCFSDQYNYKSVHKVNTDYNGRILNGVFPVKFEINQDYNLIETDFSVDYVYYDDDLIKAIRKKEERKKRKDKINKLNHICELSNKI